MTQSILGQTSPFVYLLPIVGSMLVSWGIYQVLTQTKVENEKKVRDRLRGSRPKADAAVESILRRTATDTSNSIAESILGRFKFIPRVQTMLDQADIPWLASSLLFNLVGVGLVVSIGMVFLRFNVFLSIGCGFAVVLLPLVVLNMKRNRRMNKLASQLPDVFEMMSQALRAGHSLAGSIQTVYEQMPPPIATEFAQVYHEQNLGVKIEEALKSMAERIDSLDVRFFVTAVLIQRQTGGDLAEVLDNISGVIRERIELAGLVRGLTAEGRLSGWVLFALPIIVFMGSMWLNPDYAGTLLEDPTGKIMLMVALGMQLMGIAMIRWIVNIKV
jgi:tight adherence protein B